jgi:Tropinone reductase 1
MRSLKLDKLAPRLNFLSNFDIRVPLGRPGQPEEIGALVAFLYLPPSTYFTDQILIADGGLTIRSP